MIKAFIFMALPRLTVVAWLLLLAGCSADSPDVKSNRQSSIEEIIKVEKDFQKMTEDKGVAEAFWFYADSNAVIKRENDTIIRGKEAIRKYYSQPIYARASVAWSPDFTDVSGEGDMSYTYGKYTWRIEDSTGKIAEMKGVFHTVWKRQVDGNWKYVWD